MRINNQVFFIILSLIYLGSCSLDLYLISVMNYPTSFYQCLTTKGHKQIALSAEMLPITLDHFFNQWVKAKNVGLNMDLIYFPCRPYNPVDKIAQMMKNKPQGFDGTIWVNPVITSDEGIYDDCKWKNEYGYDTNCRVLGTYLKLLKQKGVKVGIAAWHQDWISAFGDKCKELGTEKLMWFTNENTQNYDSFKPFGGWTKPSSKKIAISAQECGRNIEWGIYTSPLSTD